MILKGSSKVPLQAFHVAWNAEIILQGLGTVEHQVVPDSLPTQFVFQRSHQRLPFIEQVNGQCFGRVVVNPVNPSVSK